MSQHTLSLVSHVQLVLSDTCDTCTSNNVSLDLQNCHYSIYIRKKVIHLIGWTLHLTFTMQRYRLGCWFRPVKKNQKNLCICIVFWLYSGLQCNKHNSYNKTSCIQVCSQVDSVYLCHHQNVNKTIAWCRNVIQWNYFINNS